jgi:hypothetical protein
LGKRISKRELIASTEILPLALNLNILLLTNNMFEFNERGEYRRELIEEAEKYGVEKLYVLKIDLGFDVMCYLWERELTGRKITIGKVSDDIKYTVSVLKEIVEEILKPRELVSTVEAEPYEDTELLLTPKGRQYIDEVRKGTPVYEAKKYRELLMGEEIGEKPHDKRIQRALDED